MKYIKYVLCIILASYTLEAQENFNFDTEPFVWSKVVITDLTKKEIIDKYLTSPSVTGVRTVNDQVVFSLHIGFLDTKKFGLRWRSTPTYIYLGDFYGSVVVQFKEGRHKITVKDIFFKHDGSTYNLAHFAVKGGTNNQRTSPEFRKHFLVGIEVLDYQIDKAINDVPSSEGW